MPNARKRTQARRATFVRDQANAETQSGSLNKLRRLDVEPLQSDTDAIGVLEKAIQVCIGAQVEWRVVTETATAVRGYLIKSRWERRRLGWELAVGRTRRLPRWLYSQLKWLANPSTARTRRAVELVRAHAIRLNNLAERIERADRLWEQWEIRRVKRCTAAPTTDESQWRYPRIRAAFFAVDAFCSDCQVLADALFAAPPTTDLRKGDSRITRNRMTAWHTVLGRMWAAFVEHDSTDHLRPADMIHARVIAIHDIAYLTRAAICAAAPDLDDTNASIYDRQTTRLIGALQETMACIPRFHRRSEGPRPDPAGIAAEIYVTLRPLQVFLRRHLPFIRQLNPATALQSPVPLPPLLSPGAAALATGASLTPMPTTQDVSTPAIPPASSSSDLDMRIPLADRIRTRLHLLPGNPRYIWDCLEGRCLNQRQLAAECGYSNVSQVGNDVTVIRRTLGEDAITRLRPHGYYRNDAQPNWATVTTVVRRNMAPTR